MMTIRTSDEFKSAYKRLKKKYKSLEADFGALLVSLQENPRQGVEILEDIWKIRMNITSKGRGNTPIIQKPPSAGNRKRQPSASHGQPPLSTKKLF